LLNLMQLISHHDHHHNCHNHHHQYLCSTCGSILKETTEHIEIHLLKEECPSCGSTLAKSLIRKTLRHDTEISSPSLLPPIQTADKLLVLNKLRFDIPSIDSFIELRKRDLCCISGYGANMLLTRLCIRSLLPERHGGLDSPYVMVADAGNHTDVYGAINFARQYGMSKKNVAERILVVRAFTVHQVRLLISVKLPEIVQKYQIRSVIVPGLLNVFDEDLSMRMKDVKKEISRIMEAINELSSRVLVVTSIQQGHNNKHSESILQVFKKRINILHQNEKYGILKAEIYNQGNIKVVNLTERELKIISKK
jgi:DNA-directed RNA polymerase subunit RPC12/RpoP